MNANFLDITSIALLLQNNQLDQLLQSSLQESFDLIKLTLSLLTTLADLQEENPEESSFQLFKACSSKIIQIAINPIITRILDIQPNMKELLEGGNELFPQLLSKWWVNYLSLVDEIYSKKMDIWGGDLKFWIQTEEISALEKSISCLEDHFHWKVVLLRACCLRRELLPFMDYLQNIEIIRKYLLADIEKELYSLQMTKSQNEKKIKGDSNLLYRETILKSIFTILSSSDSKTQEAVLIGRMDKTQFEGLSHSVIIGEDGGFYSLLNHITEEEEELLLQSEEMEVEFLKNLKQAQSNGSFKLIIGKGSFGIIRLCLVLTRNETSNTMKPGQIACVKKTAFNGKNLNNREVEMSEIRENVWNDYSVGEVGRAIFSPAVYDLKIVETAFYKNSMKVNSENNDNKIINDNSLQENEKESSNIKILCPINHQKAYTIQQFVPVYDGAQVFRPNGRYFGQWTHQKAYLCDLFEINSKLLNKGICMTDLKPQNTLYDGENYRGMLIDLAGVVRKRSKEELLNCQYKYIEEITEKYASPELNALEEEDEEVDLCKCTSYSMGVIIRELVLKFSYDKEFYKKLENLVNNLIRLSPKDRITVEEGLERLKAIGKEENEEKIDLNIFIRGLEKESRKNLEKFGLNKRLYERENAYINLMTSKIDFEKHENNEISELNFEIGKFLHENHDENVFVLLGASGSGKSTFLQRRYLEELKNWNKDDPMPFYLNLAVEEDLRIQWKWICQEIGVDLNFNIFSGGLIRYPVNLFIDSFDEVGSKINFIEKFSDNLGNNPRNKFLICCRSEFIQKETDLQRYFKPISGNFLKRYIVPLNKTEFNYESYIKKYYSYSKHETNIEEIIKKIVQKNLKGLMKTSFMVQLTLDVLPELMSVLEITRRKIYEKYIFATIEKVSFGLKELLMVKFQLKNNDDFKDFIMEAGYLLAGTLHEASISKLDYKKGEKFFSKYFYDINIPCLENQFLIGIIRSLDLNIEIKGLIPKESISLGFMHDSIKNYFLTSLIFKEALNNQQKTLESKLFIEDEALMKFLAETVKENEDFGPKLKEIIYKTKTNNEINNITASSNAISILIAANVSFAGENLQGIRINSANLKDGLFNGCDFTDADLSNVNLKSCKIKSAIFNGTKLKNISLGLLPNIKTEREVTSVSFSRDNSLILCSCKDNTLRIWDKASGKILRSIITSHFDSINFACFSSDDYLILSGSDDNTMQIYEASNGKTLKTIINSYGVLSGSFSPDSMRIVTGSKDNNVRIWGKAGWKLLRTFEGHQNWVTCVGFSGDGTIIISASRDNSIKLWDRGRKKLLRTLNGHSSWVNAACFSPDGSLILSGSHDSTLKLWDKNTGNLLKTIEGHSDAVSTVYFDPKGLVLLSGSKDQTAKLWDKNTGKLLQSFEGHIDSINSVCFSKDGALILSGSKDQTIRIWDRSTDQILKIYEGHFKEVNFVGFSPDETCFITASSDNTVKIWDTVSSRLLKTLEGHLKEVSCASFSPDMSKIISSSFDHYLILWNFHTGLIIHRLEGHTNAVKSVCFNHDGKLILSCSKDKSIRLWDSTTGDTLNIYQGHSNWVNNVCFSPEQDFFCSASDDKTVILWQLSTGKKVKTFIGHNDAINSVCFSLDGKLILSGSDDFTIRLWEKNTGNILKTYEGHKSWVYNARFSYDETMIISASQDKTVKIWDLKSMKLIKTLKDHTNSVNSACFSKDGTKILSGSSDNSIRIWEILNGDLSQGVKFKKGFIVSNNKSLIVTITNENSIKIWDKISRNLLRNLKGHNGKVTCIVFLSDDTQIISGSDDKSLKLWDTYQGKLLKTFEGHEKSIICACFSGNGELIISGSKDKTIKLWDKITGDNLRTYKGIVEEINYLSFSYDDSFILCKYNNKSMRILEQKTGNILEENNHMLLTHFARKDITKFECVLILSPSETALNCKKMIILESEDLLGINETILVQRGANKMNSNYENNILKESFKEKKEEKAEVFIENKCFCKLI